MIKLLKTLLSLCVLAAAIVGVWSTIDSGDAPAGYRTVPITRGSISEVVTANGTLNPMELVTVGTQVSGQVSKIYVSANEKVKKGQLLAELDPALLLTELKQARTAMETAQLIYEQAARDLDRTRTLVEKDYLPKIDLERAQQQYFSSRNGYESAKSAVERSEVNLNYTKIYSPIDGVIISQVVTLGQTLIANYQTPDMFSIAGDLVKMKIDVNFSESDISKVKERMPIKFTVSAYPDREFDGVIHTVNLKPKSEQGVVTYSVVVSVDNKDEALLPGMTANIILTLLETKDVLRVPPAALRFAPPAEKISGLKTLFQPSLRNRNRIQAPQNANPFTGTIYLLKNGTPKAVTVTIGVSDESNIAIYGEDFQEGDEVIVGLAPVRR